MFFWLHIMVGDSFNFFLKISLKIAILGIFPA